MTWSSESVQDVIAAEMLAVGVPFRREAAEVVAAGVEGGDGWGLLVPKSEEPLLYVHPYASALDAHGLLRIITPETAVTQAVAESIAEMILELLDAGAFAEIPTGDPRLWPRLSSSRLGLNADSVGAEYMCSVLAERGLARGSQKGDIYLLPYELRLAYLVLLAQHHRDFAGVDGMSLHPTLSPEHQGGLEAEHSFLKVLDSPGMPTKERAMLLGHDMTILDCDLSNVPLDEVISYKNDHQDDFARYRSSLHDMALKLSIIEDQSEREVALLDRERELLDAAHDLRRGLRLAWKTPKNTISFSLGIAGAAWSRANTNPIGAVVAGLGAAVALLPDEEHRSVYSYVVRASHLS